MDGLGKEVSPQYCYWFYFNKMPKESFAHASIIKQIWIVSSKLNMIYLVVIICFMLQLFNFVNNVTVMFTHSATVSLCHKHVRGGISRRAMNIEYMTGEITIYTEGQHLNTTLLAFCGCASYILSTSMPFWIAQGQITTTDEGLMEGWRSRALISSSVVLQSSRRKRENCQDGKMNLLQWSHGEVVQYKQSGCI